MAFNFKANIKYYKRITLFTIYRNIVQFFTSSSVGFNFEQISENKFFDKVISLSSVSPFDFGNTKVTFSDLVSNFKLILPITSFNFDET